MCEHSRQSLAVMLAILMNSAVSRTVLCPVAIYDEYSAIFFRSTPELLHCQSEMMPKFQIEWATLVVGLFVYVGMWWCVMNPII